MHIYADDRTIHECTSKTRDDQWFAAGHSFDLALNLHWEKYWLVIANSSKSKKSYIPSSLIQPQTTSHDEWMPPNTRGGTVLDRLLGLTLTLDLKCNTKIRSISKDAGKLLVLCTAPTRIWNYVLYSKFTRAISNGVLLSYLCGSWLALTFLSH